MHDLNENPIAWFQEFAQGLIPLIFIQLLTGCWTALIIRTNLTTPSKLSLCFPVLAALAYLSYFIFDPRTHLIGRVIGSIAMLFTTPLQASAWIHTKSKPGDDDTSFFELVMRIAVSAAVPSQRRPADKTKLQLIRGIIYTTIAVLFTGPFQRVADHGGVVMDIAAIILFTSAITGSLNLMSVFLGCVGVKTASPMQKPLLSKTMAEFWNRRWNAPVSDALRIGVYNPLRHVYGFSRMTAMMACFLASAIAHEVILVYCGVTSSRGEWFLFFTLSGLLTAAEHRFRPDGIVGYVASMTTFLVMLHYLFFPITIRSGLVREGIKMLNAGPLLVQHLQAHPA